MDAIIVEVGHAVERRTHWGSSGPGRIPLGQRDVEAKGWHDDDGQHRTMHGRRLAADRCSEMVGPKPSCEAFLKDQVPNGWRTAVGHSQRLATRLQFLPWPDRARLMDDFIWGEARRLLSNDEITAVINRQPYTLATSHAILEYTTMCSAVMTSILILLAEREQASCAHHALILLVSRDAEHQEAGVEWVRHGGFQSLQAEMTGLPGFAFLYLAVYPNDSAESFMARDAFWTAMLGY